MVQRNNKRRRIKPSPAVQHVFRHAAIHRLGAALLLVLLLGNSAINADAGEPEQPASLRDLNADAVPLLRQLPNVVEVGRQGSTGRPTHRIIHIADWHFVAKNAFAADLRSLSSDPISDEDIDLYYAEHLDDVEAIQAQQLELLRTLIDQHGLKKVYVEGLAADDEFIFEAKVTALRNVGQAIQELRTRKNKLLAIRDPDDGTRAILDQIQAVESQHRSDLIHLGAAGRLLLNEEIAGVLPLEDRAAHAASNPVADDGSVCLDRKLIEKREDAQVRLLLEGEPVAVVILGGAHDLNDNLERLSDGQAEYIRVEVKAWKRIAEEGE